MSSPTTATITTTTVFEHGRFKTVLNQVDLEKSPCFLLKVGPSSSTSSSSSNNEELHPPPPKPLLISSPAVDGEYPVLLFLHGYLSYNYFYSQIILHISSHGFIVVAPQLYLVAGADASEEVESAAAITNWLPDGLRHLLPPNVHPNLSKLALSGHSRGGKVAFALALKKATSLKFSALIGVDPVDGLNVGRQTVPPVLSFVPHSFDLKIAVMVIGSGLGEIRRLPLFPPCAPKGVNHANFYEESCKPRCYFVAKDYGHLDMLDDDTKGIRGKSTYCLCKNGQSREPMRRFVAGVMVAFLKAYLEDDFGHLLAIKDQTEALPLELQQVHFQL